MQNAKGRNDGEPSPAVSLTLARSSPIGSADRRGGRSKVSQKCPILCQHECALASGGAEKSGNPSFKTQNSKFKTGCFPLPPPLSHFPCKFNATLGYG